MRGSEGGRACTCDTRSSFLFRVISAASCGTRIRAGARWSSESSRSPRAADISVPGGKLPIRRTSSPLVQVSARLRSCVILLNLRVTCSISIHTWRESIRSSTRTFDPRRISPRLRSRFILRSSMDDGLKRSASP